MADVFEHLRLALPIAGGLVLDLANSYAPIIVAGHYFDAETLAAVALGNMVFNLAGLSICYGLASALDTLLAQAHGAVASPRNAADSSEPQRSPPQHPGRAHLRWTALVLVAAAIPLAAICLFSGELLTALGQPRRVAAKAGRITQVLFFGSGFTCVTRTVQSKVLNTAREKWPPAVGTAVGSLCQLAWLLHFLRGGRLDTAPFPYARDGEAYLGCVLGKVCYSWGAAAFTGLYLVATRNKVCPLGCAVCPRWRRGRRRWAAGDREQPLLLAAAASTSEPIGHAVIEEAAPRKERVPAGARLVCALAWPSLGWTLAEWWSFECLALMAGWLPKAEATESVAANGVLFVICVISYQVFKSLGIAAGIRVGNALGAGEEASAATARRACWLGVAASVEAAAVFACFLSGFSHAFAKAVAANGDNARVVEIASDAAPAAAIACLGFALLMPVLQVLVGCGRQKVGTLITFCGCWLLGLPLAAALAFGGRLGLKGIWIGNAAGLCVGGLVGVAYIARRIDWHQEVELAQARVRR